MRHKNFTLILMVLGLLAALLLSRGSVFASGNLILNPEFDSGTANWSLGNWGGAASTWSVVTGAGLSGANAAKVTISNPGTAAYHIQLRQALPITAGRTYTITFMAKADAVRSINVVIQQLNSPWTTYWTSPAANLTTTAQTFSYTFNATTTDAGTMFEFYLGANATSVYIDNVVVSDDSSGPTATNTPIPPTATRTNTSTLPTATRTNTPAPPTATRTNTPVPPTATRTNTPMPPTATSSATTLNWSGYTWDIKSGSGLGPGPNNWSNSNSFVDANGDLHLKITQVSGQWYCAEIVNHTSLGFGTYQFWVIGGLDTLDKNVVLGLFPYTTPAIGPDGTNEIDIEYARWGNTSNPPGNFSVYPAVTGYSYTTHPFNFSLSGGTYTTSRFNWQSQSVAFQMLGGHVNDNTNLIHAWTFSPANYTQLVPQTAMPLRLNLWLFHGAAPSNGQPVEIIVRSFTFTP